MLLAYRKADQLDLSANQLKVLRRLVREEFLMSNKMFDNLVRSVREAGEIRRGNKTPSRTFRYTPQRVKAIRRSLGKSQSEFALMLGVSVSTLQNWEQGRRMPEGPARALLRVAATHPEAVADALRA